MVDDHDSIDGFATRLRVKPGVDADANGRCDKIICVLLLQSQ